jgi:putative hydrolase of the HAD superfamily
VLLPFDFSVALEKLRRKSGAEKLIEAMEPVKFAYESGEIGRAEFLGKLKNALVYTGTESELIAAWEDIFTGNAAMFDLVKALHPHYPLYLLSNTNDLHVDLMFRDYPVFHLFKDAVYSHRVKAFKPAARIYEIALEQFGIRADETVFIDDLQPNIATALSLGFQAIRYDYKRHEDLLEKLRSMDVRVEPA